MPFLGKQARVLAVASLTLVTLPCARAQPASTTAAKANSGSKTNPSPSPENLVDLHQDYAGVFFDGVPPADQRMRLNADGNTRSKQHALYYLGLLKEDRGDISNAIDIYARVLDLDPDAIDLAAHAAYLSAQYGEPEKGRDLLEKLLTENPDHPRCHLALADFLATYLSDEAPGREKATAIARKAHERFPRNPQILERLVVMLLGWSEDREAEDVILRALDRDFDDPRYWLALGRIAQHVWPLPDPGDAEPRQINAIYQKAIDVAPGNSESMEPVADYYLTSGQPQLAEPIYRKLIEQDPKVVEPYEKLARIYIDQKVPRLNDAAEVLAELLAQHPRRPDTQRFLADVHDRLGDTAFQKATAAFKDGNQELATRYLDERVEHLNEAIDHYERALRLGRGSEGDYHYAAGMMVNANRYADAVNLLQRGLFHFPESTRLNRLLSFAYAFDEQFEEALPVFEKAVALADERSETESLDARFYFYYGTTAERLKRFDEAADLFREAIDMIPEDAAEPGAIALRARVTNYLGYMWLERDTNIDEAGQLIIRANELDPNNGAYVDSLGWFHFKKKNYQKALTELLRAEQLIAAESGGQQLDPVIFDHVARAYFHTGNKAKAIEYLTKAVEIDPENDEIKQRLATYKKARAKKKKSTPPPSARSRERERVDSPDTSEK